MIANTSDIKPNLMVHAKGSGQMGGSQGIHVGTVDHLENDGRFIKLKRQGAEDGRHHWIPLDWVESVDQNCVYISKTVDEFRNGLINTAPMQ